MYCFAQRNVWLFEKCSLLLGMPNLSLKGPLDVNFLIT